MRRPVPDPRSGEERVASAVCLECLGYLKSARRIAVDTAAVGTPAGSIAVVDTTAVHSMMACSALNIAEQRPVARGTAAVADVRPEPARPPYRTSLGKYLGRMP